MIEHEGRAYITSKEFHEQAKPTFQVSDTNKAIRSMETYEQLAGEGHIIELHKNEGKVEFASLVKSNSYNPVMLIDAVAQKAIEHHFQATSTQAVSSAKENAVLGLAGINLANIAKDPQVLLLLKAISDAHEAKALAEEASKAAQEANKNALQVREDVAILSEAMGDQIQAEVQKGFGMSGFFTVLAYAVQLGLRLNAVNAAKYGRQASTLCKNRGIEVTQINDQRYGKVNLYPAEILEEVFPKN
jgi:hypothetical protein